MGATYTRQSTYTDGDVIQAADTNDEFDQLLAAFAAGTGHTHDGTAGEGGPLSALLGHGITFGQGTAGTDIVITFDGETNDGVLKWMEDEDYFEFSDDLLIASTEKIQFRDTGIYINSSADGQLDLVADTEIQIAATTIDINGLVDISGNLSVGGNLDVTGTFDLSDSNFTNAGDIQLDSISGDSDTNTSIAFSGSDVITVTTGGETQITFNNGSILPTTDNDVDLGSSSLEFKDLYIDGTANIDTASIDALTVSGATTLAATSFGDADITNVGSIALDTITNDGTDITLDSSGDIILDADGGDVFVKDAGTTYGSLTNSSGNLVIKSGTTTALTFSGANATIAGDLTISGDDLTMATNTSGALLIADGTNFNPTLVTALSEISTVANDDVFLAVDTSGGGLKKITRSAVVAGLAASGAISNVVDDTTPQLGGNLDTNSSNILIDDAHFIGDENGNEQIVFQTTSSAVNQIEVTNAATGNGVQIASTGGDTNIDLKLLPKGSGQVVIDGNVGIESGLIDLKNAGAVSKIKFYCESSNAHAQTLQGAPHSEAASNSLTLPSTGGDVDLVSTASTATLTNKTLTAPKIADGGFIADANGNELVVFQTTSSAVNEIEITNNATGSNPIIAATGGDTNIGIALTPKGTGEIVIGAGNLNYGGTAVTSTGAELNILDGVTSTAAELNILDGVTSTAAELNILDGVTSTAAELNIVDGNTSATATTVADADRVVLNDNGTMVQVAVTDLAAYFDDEITAMPNLVTTAATTVGALDSGSITSGFGTIDTGSSNITTTGVGSFGSLDISGDIDVDGTTNLDAVDVDGAVNFAADVTFADGADIITASAGTSNFRAGVNAGNSIASGGNYNVVVGDEAGTALTTGDANVAVGFEALKTEDANGESVAVGYQALKAQNVGASGVNTAVGYLAGTAMTTGIYNVMLGGEAGDAMTDADGNVALGWRSLTSNTLGHGSTAVGAQCLFSQNYGSSTNAYNTCVGHSAGYTISTGVSNTLVGGLAGDNFATGNSNVIMGYNSDTAASDTSQIIVLGTGVTSQAANNFTFGFGATDSNIAFGATSITAPSDVRLKEDIQDEKIGLDFIKDLRPVTFRWKKAKDIDPEMRTHDPDSDERVMNGKYNHGFIAQEVKQVIDSYSDIKDGFDMWSADPTDGRQRIGEASLMPIMVKAIQELEARIATLEGKDDE